MSSNPKWQIITKPRHYSLGFCFYAVLLMSLPCIGQKFPSLVQIRGYVFDSEDSTLVPRVDVILKGNDTSIVKTQTDSSGYFEFTISRNLFKKGIIYTLTNKDVKTYNAPYGFLATELKYNIHFDSLQKEYLFPLRRVYGCGWSATLLFKRQSVDLVDSFARADYNTVLYYKTTDEIQAFCEYLKRNGYLVIELDGHSSSDESQPDSLSFLRAEAIKSKLVQCGIKADRIATKAFGARKLKLSNTQVRKHHSKAKREELHAVNRRVIFRILSWDYPAPVEQQSPKYSKLRNHPSRSGS